MLDSLQFGAMILESGLLDEAVREVMVRPQLMMLAESTPGIKDAMRSQVTRWRGQLQEQLTLVTKEKRFAEEIARYQAAIELSQEQFVAELDSLLGQLEDQSTFYFRAKSLANHPHHRYSPMFQAYFCNLWFEHIAAEIKEAQLAEMEQHKQALLEDLYQRAENIQKIPELSASGNPEQLGRLWDMAAAKLSQKERGSVDRYATFLKKHTMLQDIAAQIGRMAEQVEDDNAETTCEELQFVEEAAQDVTDDIVGIKEGDELTKLLPSETMFLAYPELEVVFYKHLLDRQLLNYQMQGKQRKLSKVQTLKKPNDDRWLDKGPFILAIDSSGSMQGFPEKCAKAMAYGLMQIALAEQRDCYVMMFSTEQITYELSKQDGLREVINFLNYEFHGGTDMNAVLTNALAQMSEQKYQNADLLILSDFIAPKPPAELMEQIEQLKLGKNRLHAINLSVYGNPELMQIFDKCWAYTPSPLQKIFKH